MNPRKYFSLFLILFFFVLNLSGQGWERYYEITPETQYGNRVFTTPDGGYLLPNVDNQSATGSNPTAAYLKTDFDGELQDYKRSNCVLAYSFSFQNPFVTFPIAKLPNGNLASFSPDFDPVSGDTLQQLEITDPAGNQISCKTAFRGNYIFTDIEAADANHLYLGGVIGWSPGVMKTDLDGNEIWRKQYSGVNNGLTIKTTADGGVLFITEVDAGIQGNGTEIYKIDKDGNEIWRNFIPKFIDGLIKPVETSAGEYLMGGRYYVSRDSGYRSSVFKLDNLGNQIDTLTFPEQFIENIHLFDLELNAQNELIIGMGYEYANSPRRNKTYRFSIVKTDLQFNILQTNNFGGDLDSYLASGFGKYIHASDLMASASGGYIITGTSKDNSAEQVFLFKTDALGNTKTNQICGKIALDENDNCMVDPGERTHNFPLLLQIIKGTDTTFTSTGQNGEFSVQVDTGDYEIQLFTGNPLWQPCQSSFTVSLPMAYDTAKVNFALEGVVDCPNLSVDIGATRYRICRTSNFTVSYCNEGTIDADSAYVDICLDSNLVYATGDLPEIDLGNNVYRFMLGTVELFECGSFSFSANVNCDNSIINRTLCTEAKIHPDTLCLPPPVNWSQASLDVSGECSGDSITFKIKNIGSGDMNQERQYIVIEDIAVMRVGEPFKLDAGEELEIKVEATGSTVRLEVNQPEDHPYALKSNATVEFCGTPPFSQGLFNQLGNSTSNPSSALYCAQVLNGYDPNEKLATPTGFRALKEIDPEVPLDYEIHFQNTGNDTAFRVVLLDTLSQNLDLKTLRVGAGSHAFEWDVFGKNILRFTFEDINLVDSFTNEPGSQGFVRYSIEAKEGLDVSTEITNAADIYFDFNSPIYTNQTYHTIGFDDFDEDGFGSDEDCDDENPGVNPDAPEIINNDVDEDCDGIALIIDADMDGFNSDEDCDDENADINPGMTEIPNNNIDENCDGVVVIIDTDMDGFNSDEDCDDFNAEINPGAVEIPNNNIDEDCDGIALIIDNDMDGFNSDVDCDDENAEINPNAVDIPNNGIDEDCDGMDATSSVDETFSNSIDIYPNPADEFIFIESDGGIAGDIGIQFYDLSGKLIKTLSLKTNESTWKINTRNLQSGEYFLHISADEKLGIKKIIIVK